MRVTDKSQAQLPPIAPKKKNKYTNQKQENPQEIAIRKTLVDFMLESKLKQKGLQFQAKDGNTGIVPGYDAVFAGKGAGNEFADTENTPKAPAGKSSYVYENGMFYIE